MTHIPDLETLLAVKDDREINKSIIEMDDFLCALCGWGDGLENLTEPQRLFYFIQNLEREVNNGGFEQYFFNSSGDHAHETVVALNAVGAHKTAKILEEAISEFPENQVPADRKIRQEVMELLSASKKVWENLTERFFRYEDSLNDLNMRYVSANKAFF